MAKSEIRIDQQVWLVSGEELQELLQYIGVGVPVNTMYLTSEHILHLKKLSLKVKTLCIVDKEQAREWVEMGQDKTLEEIEKGA